VQSYTPPPQYYYTPPQIIKSYTPKTGDDINVILLLALMIGSSFGVFGVYAWRALHENKNAAKPK